MTNDSIIPLIYLQDDRRSSAFCWWNINYPQTSKLYMSYTSEMSFSCLFAYSSHNVWGSAKRVRTWSLSLLFLLSLRWRCRGPVVTKLKMLYAVSSLSSCGTFPTKFAMDFSQGCIQGGPKKPDCFLTVCNSRICWHRIAFYTSNCSVFYPE